MTLTKMIKEFHAMINDQNASEPRPLTREEYDLRMYLIREELEEFELSAYKKNLIECADSLGDLIYVVAGTAVKMGIDIDAVLAEIHRSNMTKCKGHTSASGKWTKGPDFEPPDLEKIIYGTPKKT